MEEEKNPKQKPHTSFNRRLSVVKKSEGNMTTDKKNFKKILFYRGDMTKGEYGKRYYGSLQYFSFPALSKRLQIFLRSY